jgi:hypothetical protein
LPQVCITSSFMDAYREAYRVKGLNVPGGAVAGNVDQTCELVQKGYAEFARRQAGG